jgi:hypothetical protein
MVLTMQRFQSALSICRLRLHSRRLLHQQLAGLRGHCAPAFHVFALQFCGQQVAVLCRERRAPRIATRPDHLRAAGPPGTHALSRLIEQRGQRNHLLSAQLKCPPQPRKPVSLLHRSGIRFIDQPLLYPCDSLVALKQLHLGFQIAR